MHVCTKPPVCMCVYVCMKQLVCMYVYMKPPARMKYVNQSVIDFGAHQFPSKCKEKTKQHVMGVPVHLIYTSKCVKQSGVDFGASNYPSEYCASTEKRTSMMQD